MSNQARPSAPRKPPKNWWARRQASCTTSSASWSLRAFQFFGGFRGSDGRAWLLTVVRNTCYTWLERNRPRTPATTFDEQKHTTADPAMSPPSLAERGEDRELLRQALERLPPEYREVIVLRELEGLSYKDIAGIAGIPLGTVMSRLARARERLHEALAGQSTKEPHREL